MKPSEAIVPVQVDLTSIEGLSKVSEAFEVSGGRLIGLVNNAGITRDARLVNMSDDAFRSVLEVNLGAAYRLTSAMAPLMSDGGAIVNITSRAHLGNFGQVNYAMSKGGIVGMTRAMALALAPHIRVNAVAPGLIASEMSVAIPDVTREQMIAKIPMGRMGLPIEIADTVWWLLSGESSYVTGEVIGAGGGRSL